MKNLIKVGMADYKVGKSPDSLITYGLGSCVGIAIVDERSRIGGLAHIMLPSSRDMSLTTNIAKFADTCLEAMINELLSMGAKKTGFTAKIAGGAQMFSFTTNSDVMKIGAKNIAAVKENLAKHGIKIIADDTGGNFGRTVEFDLETGDFKIKTIKKGHSTI